MKRGFSLVGQRKISFYLFLGRRAKHEKIFMGNGNAIIAADRPGQGHSMSPMSKFLFGHWLPWAPWALSPSSIKASDVMDTSGTAKTGGFQLLWEAGTVNLSQFLLLCTQTNKSSFCKGQMVTGHRCRCCSFSAVKLCPPAFPWKINYCEHG